MFPCGPCAHALVPSRFNAFHPDTRKPMHRECGFIRLEPDTNKVAFVSAQNTGTLGGRTGAPALSYAGVPARGPFVGDSRDADAILGSVLGPVCRLWGSPGGGATGTTLENWLVSFPP